MVLDEVKIYMQTYKLVLWSARGANLSCSKFTTLICRNLRLQPRTKLPTSLFSVLIEALFFFLSLHRCPRGIVSVSFSRSWPFSSRRISPSGRWWLLPPAWSVATLRALSPESRPSTGTRTITTKPSWGSAAAGRRATTRTTTAQVSTM